jgi:hypothetical protein
MFGRYQTPFDVFQLSAMFAGGECRGKDLVKRLSVAWMLCVDKAICILQHECCSTTLSLPATVYLQVFFHEPAALTCDGARPVRTPCAQTTCRWSEWLDARHRGDHKGHRGALIHAMFEVPPFHIFASGEYDHEGPLRAIDRSVVVAPSGSKFSPDLSPELQNLGFHRPAL